MPRYANYPTLFDDVLQLQIADLKKLGYLKQSYSGGLTWSSNGRKTGSITLRSFVNGAFISIELDYTHQGEPMKYRINLISQPSNLGKGLIYYFVCPNTGKLCRKLYCISGYFLHREAFQGCFYESQLHSKRLRHAYKLIMADDIEEELYSKNFKRTYAGKPTRKFLSLTKKAEKYSQQGLNSILSLRF
jgi:hypothetical protein